MGYVFYPSNLQDFYYIEPTPPYFKLNSSIDNRVHELPSPIPHFNLNPSNLTFKKIPHPSPHIFNGGHPGLDLNHCGPTYRK